jgi:hypothetical protein
MKVDNSNILTKGSSISGDKKLEFYSNKINRTNTIVVQLANTQESLEVVTPDGTWTYNVQINIPSAYAGGGTVTLIINSIDIVLPIPANLGPTVIFEKKGEPYILAKDEIKLINNLGVGTNTDFYLNFQRIMFNNE